MSVKCAGCQKSYHMACLNPPLLRKPSKGFAWQCAFCTRQEIFNHPPSPEGNNNEKTKDHGKKDSPLQSQAQQQQQQQQQQPQQEQQQQKSSKSSKSDSKRQLRATRSQATPPLPSPAISTTTTTTVVQPQKLETSIKLKINPKKGGLKSKECWLSPIQLFFS